MSVLLLYVDGVPHRRERITPATTICSCGDMYPAGGTATQKARAWKAHVQQVADALGVEVVQPEQQRPRGTGAQVVALRPVLCSSCGWQGARNTPFENYRGPTGPCPKCGERLRAVGAQKHPSPPKR